jgi:DHA1 family multidrug resistance protein-like MFS transporter
LHIPTPSDLKDLVADTLKASIIAQFLCSLAFGLMGSFMPLFINKDLGETLVNATYWTGVSNLAWYGGLAFTAPVWGWICDKVGTKRVLIIVLIGNIATYAGMAFSQNVTQLVAFRIAQSLFGGLSTILFVVVGIIASPQNLRRYLGYQIAASTISSIIAPGLGGAFAALIGYRWTVFMQAIIFAAIFPLILVMKTAKPEGKKRDVFTLADLKSILPTAGALFCAYAGISFITPVVPFFLSSLGIASASLLTWTTITTIANGFAYAAATPILTKLSSGRKITIFQLLTAVVIEATAFAFSPVVFIIMRVVIGVVQAGLPQNLLGGKSGTTGQGMGLLNSARYIGMAVGMYIAPLILESGSPPIYMYSVLSAFALASAGITYRYMKGED